MNPSCGFGPAWHIVLGRHLSTLNTRVIFLGSRWTCAICATFLYFKHGRSGEMSSRGCANAFYVRIPSMVDVSDEKDCIACGSGMHSFEAVVFV